MNGQYNRWASNYHSGFTLVEVLVVIAIIGILVGLILPAVNMARESARRTSCANNLRQIAVAVKLHEGAHQVYPTGGWGEDWVGDPDKGFSTDQPGGWIYNILPYIEQENLRELGAGQQEESKTKAIIQLMQTPLGAFNCSSRRLPRLYPYGGPASLQNASPPEKVAKSDYAISKTISFEKSEVMLSDIQLVGNGLSNTVLAGEKSVSQDAYSTGGSGDLLSMYAGDSSDIRRTPTGKPVSDRYASASAFGGPHPRGCNIAYCDGSVKFLSYDSELEEVK